MPQSHSLVLTPDHAIWLVCGDTSPAYIKQQTHKCHSRIAWYCAGLEILSRLGIAGSNPACGVFEHLVNPLTSHKNRHKSNGDEDYCENIDRSAPNTPAIGCVV